MILSFIRYMIHKEMMKETISEKGIPYQKGNFNDFVELFNTHKWTKEENFKESLFNYKDDCMIHASIFKFNGVGFICKNIFSYKKIFSFLKNRENFSNIIQFEQEKTINKLLNSLNDLATELKIPVEYCDFLGDAAGKILYHRYLGRILLDEAKIQILNDCKDTPWVLAHELGHYFALLYNNDNSEQGANREAYKLCCKILNEDEQLVIYNLLKIYFLN
jgi:hypothetical protein